MIQALTVQYGGHRFRSKLEAKWAVFLDNLRVEYQYEPTFFRLSNGRGYLPDFYLPSQDVFLEIKPTKMLSQEDYEKIVLFSQDPNVKPNLVVLHGEPSLWQDHYYHYKGEEHKRVQWTWNDTAAYLVELGVKYGNPDHPMIYAAVRESEDHRYIVVDKQ